MSWMTADVDSKADADFPLTHTHAWGTTKPRLRWVPIFPPIFWVQTSAKVMKTRIKKCRARDNEENEFSFSCIDTEICNRTPNPNLERKKKLGKSKIESHRSSYKDRLNIDRFSQWRMQESWLQKTG